MNYFIEDERLPDFLIRNNSNLNRLPEYLRDYSEGAERIESGELYLGEYDDLEEELLDITSPGRYNSQVAIQDSLSEEITGENSWLDYNIRLAQSNIILYNTSENKVLYNRLQHIKKFGYTDLSRIDNLKPKQKAKYLIYRSIIQQLQKLLSNVNNQIIISRTVENIKLLVR